MSTENTNESRDLHEEDAGEIPLTGISSPAMTFQMGDATIETAFHVLICAPLQSHPAGRAATEKFLASAKNGYIVAFQSEHGTVGVRPNGTIGFLNLEDGRRFTHDELVDLETVGRVLGKWWREGWPPADRVTVT